MDQINILEAKGGSKCLKECKMKKEVDILVNQRAVVFIKHHMDIYCLTLLLRTRR